MEHCKIDVLSEDYVDRILIGQKHSGDTLDPCSTKVSDVKGPRLLRSLTVLEANMQVYSTFIAPVFLHQSIDCLQLGGVPPPVNAADKLLEVRSLRLSYQPFLWLAKLRERASIKVRTVKAIFAVLTRE